jgi:type I restriction enzyme R subunit
MQEEHRAAREGLSEDELAVFDLLTKPKPKLSKTQEQCLIRMVRRQ